jgi:dTMP kinase
VTAQPAVVVLLGIDGAGKTTQAARLADTLGTQGRPVTLLTGRGWTETDERIERSLARYTATPAGLAAYWFTRSVLAARRMAEVIDRAGAEPGAIVVADRYLDCHLALHRVFRVASDEATVRALFRVLPPTAVTVWLDLPVATALHRIRQRGTDTETPGYLRALRDAYLCGAEARRYRRIDGTGSPDAVHARVVGEVARALPVTGGTRAGRTALTATRPQGS